MGIFSSLKEQISEHYFFIFKKMGSHFSLNLGLHFAFLCEENEQG